MFCEIDETNIKMIDKKDEKTNGILLPKRSATYPLIKDPHRIPRNTRLAYKLLR